MVADRAHCPPWALDDAPSWWAERVRLALSAENGAAAELQRKQERQARRRSAGASLNGRR